MHQIHHPYASATATLQSMLAAIPNPFAEIQRRNSLRGMLDEMWINKPLTMMAAQSRTPAATATPAEATAEAPAATEAAPAVVTILEVRFNLPSATPQESVRAEAAAVNDWLAMVMRALHAAGHSKCDIKHAVFGAMIEAAIADTGGFNGYLHRVVDHAKRPTDSVKYHNVSINLDYMGRLTENSIGKGRIPKR